MENQSPRAVLLPARTGGEYVLYDPAKSRNFKEYIKVVAAQHRPDKLLEEPLQVTVKVYKPMLKKFSKKKLAEPEAGMLRPVTKLDVDNYVKRLELESKSP